MAFSTTISGHYATESGALYINGTSTAFTKHVENAYAEHLSSVVAPLHYTTDFTTLIFSASEKRFFLLLLHYYYSFDAASSSFTDEYESCSNTAQDADLNILYYTVHTNIF